MAYTFEQLYARVLEQDIDTITSNNFNVQVGNDINTLLSARNKPSGNLLPIIIESGKGIQSEIANQVLVTQPTLIYFYVDNRYTQSFLKQLTDYVTAQNNIDRRDVYLDIDDNMYFASGIGRTLTYSFNITATTPYVSPNLVSYGANQFQEVILQVNVMYSDELFYINDMSFQFRVGGSGPYNNINRVVTYQINQSILGDKAMLGSNKITTMFKDGDEVNITFAVNYDLGDLVHRTLRRLIVKPNTQLSFRLIDHATNYQYDAVAYLRVNLTGQRKSNSLLTITVSTVGDFSEFDLSGGV